MINLRAFLVEIWSRNSPKVGGNETLEVRRVLTPRENGGGIDLDLIKPEVDGFGLRVLGPFKRLRGTSCPDFRA